jgi:hypothetical protein
MNTPTVAGSGKPISRVMIVFTSSTVSMCGGPAWAELTASTDTRAPTIRRSIS